MYLQDYTAYSTYVALAHNISVYVLKRQYFLFGHKFQSEKLDQNRGAFGKRKRKEVNYMFLREIMASGTSTDPSLR